MALKNMLMIINCGNEDDILYEKHEAKNRHEYLQKYCMNLV